MRPWRQRSQRLDFGKRASEPRRSSGRTRRYESADPRRRFRGLYDCVPPQEGGVGRDPRREGAAPRRGLSDVLPLRAPIYLGAACLLWLQPEGLRLGQPIRPAPPVPLRAPDTRPRAGRRGPPILALPAA